MKQENYILMAASSSNRRSNGKSGYGRSKKAFRVWMSCAIICRWGCPVILDRTGWELPAVTKQNSILEFIRAIKALKKMMRFFQKGKRSPAGSIFVGYQYTHRKKRWVS